jgi:hypothetical protein
MELDPSTPQYLKTLSDAQLIAALRNDDGHAFAEILRRYKDYVYQLAVFCEQRRLGGIEARQLAMKLVGTVLEQFWEQRRQHPPGTKIRAHLAFSTLYHSVALRNSQRTVTKINHETGR